MADQVLIPLAGIGTLQLTRAAYEAALIPIAKPEIPNSLPKPERVLQQRLNSMLTQAKESLEGPRGLRYIRLLAPRGRGSHSSTCTFYSRQGGPCYPWTNWRKAAQRATDYRACSQTYRTARWSRPLRAAGASERGQHRAIGFPSRNARGLNENSAASTDFLPRKFCTTPSNCCEYLFRPARALSWPRDR
jgi:hypothetical protein